MKLRTLNSRIAVALFTLTACLSLIYVAAAIYLMPLYQQEVQQKLNLTLAEHIAKDIPVLSDGSANQPALEDLFHTLMTVNPSIELYLVDPAGEILAFNAEPGKVQADSIELEQVRRYLDGSEPLPIRGADPRNPGLAKVFSAAPVYENETLAGYLYIILGGENYDTIVQMVRDSYILRLLLWIGIAAFGLSLLTGYLSLNWLTRRVRQLSGGVQGFNEQRFESPIQLTDWRRGKNGDEIDEMGSIIEKMSATIVQQLSQLRHSDTTRRELIANISHDLRTPLASMQAYLETLQMKIDELPESTRDEYLEMAIKSSGRLSSLISDLFELAMLETPGSKAEFEQFSLAELVQDVSQEFELKIKQSDLRLVCNVPKDAPFAQGDIAMIERVLVNLIENAIKFSKPGDTIEVSVTPEGSDLRVRVDDTGLGIAPEDVPRIFERSFRVDKSRSNDTKSSGLGLAIAHRIMELHERAIIVNSQPGKGSSFSFNLPMA